MARQILRVRHGVPILMYHLVTNAVPTAFRSYTVTPTQFRAQVRTLVRLGYHSVTPSELADARQGVGSLPRRPVVITFDDGFRDCLRLAAPVLHDAGMRATMYVVAGLLGGRSRFLMRERLDLPLVSAAEARELEQAGIDCQSHALTHARLADLDTTEIAHELVTSRDVLEQALGHEVRHVAYPHGSFDDRVTRLADLAGYRSAYTTQPGKATAADSAMALPRVKVDGRESSTLEFLARLTTGRHLGHPLRPQPLSTEGRT